ncbi:hypothetical protein B0H13DRAFT_2319930 [Mycena leptocephala]|nr:hypothetical protein B0H13DRAFT_2319930 [Mycena leptocephala]
MPMKKPLGFVVSRGICVLSGGKTTLRTQMPSPIADAMSLHHPDGHFREVNHREDAMRADEEAVQLRHELAKTDPTVTKDLQSEDNGHSSSDLKDTEPETPVESFTTNVLTCIQANLGIGGSLMSIHEPAEAVSGCGGPFAWMLSPEEPALAIFGSYNEPVVVNTAQSLADSSGFPVVIRPACDYPALTLLAHDTDTHNGYVRFNNTGGNNDERRRDLDDEGEAVNEDERTPGETGNGGRRDDDPDDPEPNGHGLNTREEHKPNQDGGAQAPGGGDGGGGARRKCRDCRALPRHCRARGCVIPI